MVAWMKEPAKSYERRVKGMILKRAVRFFDGFDYQSTVWLDDEMSALNRIIPLQDSEASDCVKGVVNGTKVKMYSLRTKSFRSKVRRGREYYVKTSSFRGTVIVLQMEKKLSSKTVFMNRSLVDDRMFGRVDTSFIDDPAFEVARLEDPDMDKKYVIYTTSQLEVRRLLTPDVMVRLDRLSQFYGGPIRCSYANDLLAIAFPSSGELFSPRSITERPDYVDDLHSFLGRMHAIMALMNALVIT
jgi:hypothetical protein